MSDTILHASCVSFNGRAALITGSSGSGKSALALELMAYGASLVADDRVVLRAQDGQITASAPDTIKGLIEARGFGILNADPVDHADVVVCIDLDQRAHDRIPAMRQFTILGCDIPLFYAPDGVHLGAAILQYLRAGQSFR